MKGILRERGRQPERTVKTDDGMGIRCFYPSVSACRQRLLRHAACQMRPAVLCGICTDLPAAENRGTESGIPERGLMESAGSRPVYRQDEILL